MDKFQFAKLIAFIQTLKLGSQSMLEGNEIAEIDRLIMNGMPKQEPVLTSNVTQINRLFEAMRDGRKIDAIKEHRSLTGLGLKESKDTIEMYWTAK